MMKRIIFIAAAFLSACSPLAPRETGTGFLFPLEPIRIIQQGPQTEALVVMTPTAAPQLDSQRIALLKDGKRWDYYAGARWSAFLPLLVRDNVARSLEHARIFKSVVTDESGLEGGRLLKTEIRSFHADYDAGAAPTVRIDLRLSVVTRMERRAIASFDATAAQKAASPRLTDIQAAFALAFKEAERQVVAEMGKAARPAP